MVHFVAPAELLEPPARVGGTRLWKTIGAANRTHETIRPANFITYGAQNYILVDRLRSYKRRRRMYEYL